jgi:phenylacetate-CoA ligase
MASIEAYDRRQLDAWQLAQLQLQFQHARANSPFYRDLWKRHSLPTELPSLQYLQDLPFTTKEDLRDHYPFGFLAAKPNELVRYGESTGTSGRSTSSFFTFDDWVRGNVWVESALQHYFSPEDMVFVAIPYELTFASYDIDRALEQLGAMIVPVGALNQVCPFSRVIEMMRELHPTGLVCTPSRALRLFDMLLDCGYDPLRVGLRKLLYVGETCSPAKLAKIADIWGVKLVTAYGSTETNSLALPCRLGQSHLSEARYLFEVIGDSGKPLGPGELGELVLTSLGSRAMPLIRYRTGDLAIVQDAPCGCGISRRVLHHHGRSCETIVADGVAVEKLALEQTILSVPGTGTYYVAGTRDGRLRVLVEVACDSSFGVCSAVQGAIRRSHRLSADVEAISRRALTEAMDRMLKPGSLQLEDVERTLCA